MKLTTMNLIKITEKNSFIGKTVKKFIILILIKILNVIKGE